MLLTYFPDYLISVIICFVCFIIFLYFYQSSIEPKENMLNMDSVYFAFIISFVWPFTALVLIIILFTYLFDKD